MVTVSSQAPFLEPPAFKPLQGDLTSSFSRRLNYQHRIVYRVFEPTKEVKILRDVDSYQTTHEIAHNKYYVKNLIKELKYSHSAKRAASSKVTPEAL